MHNNDPWFNLKTKLDKSNDQVSTADVSPTTSTTATVASSGTAVTLFASNTNALSRSVQNESTANAFIKFGASASLTDYKVKVPAGLNYEFPRPLYTGLVTIIWDAVNGNARTSEES